MLYHTNKSLAFLAATHDHLRNAHTKGVVIDAITTTIRIFLGDLSIPGEPTSSEEGLVMHLIIVGYIPAQLLHLQEPDIYTAG
jgi:hypothetical protein